MIGAYNAGAGAVKRWMREAGTMDADVFVERTPFVETRGYVARVLGWLGAGGVAGSPTPVFPQAHSALKKGQELPALASRDRASTAGEHGHHSHQARELAEDRQHSEERKSAWFSASSSEA